MTGPLAGSARARSRHAHRRAVLRRAARRAGRRGHQDRAAARRRLHARDRPVRRPTTAYSLFWAVEGRGRKSVTLDLRTPEGQDLFRRLAATADVVVENFRPGHARAVEHRPDRSRPRASSPCASRCSARTARTRRGPGSTASASATAACCTSPATPTARRCASASRSPTTSPACSPRRPRSRALVRARRARRHAARSIDAALYGAVLRILEWTLAGVRPARHRAQPRGQPARQLGAARQLPDRATASTCASSPAPTPTSRACARRWTGPTSLDDPRFAKLADRAAHGDEINGIVAEWTATLDARRRSRQRCVAHDVPVATAYTAADIFADPHIDRPRRPRDRRRPGDRPDPPAGAVPAPRRRDAAAPAGAPRLGEHTDEVLATLLGARRRRARPRCATKGVDLMARRADPPTGCSSSHDDGTIALIGGYSPTSGRYHFPLLDTCPYTRRDRRRARRRCRATATLWAWTAVTAAPPGLRGPGAVRLRRRRARRTSGCASITRLTRARSRRGSTFGQPMRLVADDAADDDGDRGHVGVRRRRERAGRDRRRRHPSVRTVRRPHRSPTWACTRCAPRSPRPATRAFQAAFCGTAYGGRRVGPQGARRARAHRHADRRRRGRLRERRRRAAARGRRDPRRPVRLRARVRRREDAEGHHPLVVLRAVARGGRARGDARVLRAARRSGCCAKPGSRRTTSPRSS